MKSMSRRGMIAGAAALTAGRARAQAKPIRIGLLSDMSGPYAAVGGPGNRVGADLAAEDFNKTVLGRPVEILQADMQNKPDVAASIAREWIDNQGVDVIADGAASSSGLAIQQITREKGKIYLATGPATSDLTGAQCSPTGMQFCYDTYALANGVGGALTKAGGDSWFFITADYAFGYALERDTTNFVTKSGGKVLGAVKAPLATSDFSSYLVQAAASNAKVVGLANAGTDLQNCIKQAAEFGIVRKGQRLATLLMAIVDIVAVGQKACEGLVFTDSFYWDMTDATRAWTKRYMAHLPSAPSLLHAGNYCAVHHYLSCVDAAKTTDVPTVVAKMKETRINDMYNRDVLVRADGRVMHEMYLWQVKPPSESKYANDFCTKLATIPGEQAYRPLALGGCSFIKA